MSLLAQIPGADTGRVVVIVAILVALIFGLIVLAVFARYFRLWIQSVTTGAGIGIFDLLGMTFRKVNPAVIVRSKIMAVQAGIGDEQGVTSKALEAHYLAGGNVPLVIRALIAAAQGQARSIWTSSWPRPSTWPAATCSKPCRPASIPR